MSLTLPGGTDRLSRDREDAHARYHDALAALDRIVNDITAASAARPDDADAARFATLASLLVQFVQQITPYVDTKLRVIEQAAADATMTAAVAQRTAAAVGRTGSSDVGRTGNSAVGRTGDSDVGRTGSSDVGRTFRSASDAAPAASVDQADVARTFRSADSSLYLAFEDLFRGSEAEIRARQADYVPLFAGARDVLDVGCGRGEFLALLTEAAVSARGVDLNEEMVAACRAKGLRAEAGDAVNYLRGLPDESLGGLFAAQVVEHLPPPQLLAFIQEAARTLRPGARLVLETINPTCWVAFFESYIRDLTHAKPLHPDTLKYLVVANGFQSVEVRFRTAIPESDRLHRVAAATGNASPQLKALVDAFNLNMERLNDRIFTSLDYAIVGVRG